MTTKHRLQGEYIHLLMLRPDAALEQSKAEGGNTMGLYSELGLAEAARDEYINDIDDGLTKDDFIIYRMPIKTSRESINFSLDYLYLSGCDY